MLDVEGASWQRGFGGWGEVGEGGMGGDGGCGFVLGGW